MANIVETRLVLDGPRHVVALVSIQGDGSADETNFPILDPELVSPVCDHFSVKKLRGLFNGQFRAQLQFGGTTPANIVDVPGTTQEVDWDFTREGGISDPLGPNYDGTITLTTAGLVAGETASIYLHCTKHAA